MHLLPVEPGLRLLTLNIAGLESSSAKATVPAAQLLVGLEVVEENAEYDACQTIAPLASRATGTEATATNHLRENLDFNMTGGCLPGNTASGRSTPTRQNPLPNSRRPEVFWRQVAERGGPRSLAALLREGTFGPSAFRHRTRLHPSPQRRVASGPRSVSAGSGAAQRSATGMPRMPAGVTQ